MSQDPIPPEKEFTAFHPRQPFQVERRTATRYLIAPRTLVLMRLADAAANLEGWAHDLSGRGIGVNLPHALPVGTAAVVRIRARKPVGMLLLPARVRHATAQADGTWRVGCAFDQPLDPDLMEALL